MGRRKRRVSLGGSKKVLTDISNRIRVLKSRLKSANTEISRLKDEKDSACAVVCFVEIGRLILIDRYAPVLAKHPKIDRKRF